MLGIKEFFTNLANKAAIDITERKVTWSNVTIPANNSNNTNLKTIIDNDMPSGYKFVGISGFSTNDIYITPISVRYHDSAYSLQVSNRYNTNRTTNIEVYYLCVKVGGGTP